MRGCDPFLMGCDSLGCEHRVIGLSELHGMEFQKFMLERLVPVVGDISQYNLGIDTDMADILRKEVDIIITSAATTTFDERFQSKRLSYEV